MSPRTDIPEPWKSAMAQWGMHSARDLASKTGIGASTVTGLIYGDRSSSEQTLQAVAAALRVEVTTVREWASAARGEARPFVLPAEADRLTRREREAVLAVVRAMLDPADEEQSPLVQHSAGSGKTNSLAEAAAIAEEHGYKIVLVDDGSAPITGPEPATVHDYGLAARRGASEGRRIRNEQDADAES